MTTSNVTRAWGATDPPPLGYLVVPHETTEWRPGWDAGLIERDLGFRQASSGVLDAVTIRADSGGSEGADWPGPDRDLTWLLVTGGRLELSDNRRSHLVLDRHDAVYLPRGCRPTRYWYSNGFEAVLLRGDYLTDGERGWPTGGPVVSMKGPHSAVPLGGGAQRPYFEYRDFGLGDLTGGRMGLNLTSAIGPAPDGGTGYHWHTMAQWNLTLAGWYDIRVDGHELRRLCAGDSTFTPTELPHHVTGFSRDVAILNFTVPAEFETVEM